MTSVNRQVTVYHPRNISLFFFNYLFFIVKLHLLSTMYYTKLKRVVILGSMMAAPLGLQDFNNCCTRTPSLLPIPVTINRHQQQQQQQPFGFGNRQQPRHRLAHQPHFRPQPLEPPAPPPALSVAFTAVVCPWWTVLDGKRAYSNN